MSRRLLITSGAYIGEEMQAEFGRIPPAFLPVGPRYMIQHQLARLPAGCAVWLSLPNDFQLDEAQGVMLEQAGVSVVRIDPSRSLGMSVFQSLLEIGADGGIEILHGDTLISVPASQSDDGVSVSRPQVQYRWGLVEIENGRAASVSHAAADLMLADDTMILSGYFSLVDVPVFLRDLSRCDFNFVGALDRYCAARAVDALTEVETLDVGHLKTYYASRHALAAARHFNALEIDGYTVRKESRDRNKIEAEAFWLRSIPAALQPFGARLIEDRENRDPSAYRTLYAHLPTAAELYLARPPRFVWNKLLESCHDYLARAAEFCDESNDDTLEWLAVTKLRERVSAHPEAYPPLDLPLRINGRTIGSINDLIDRIAEQVADAAPRPAQVMHGDFCFSNILFDPRSERIQLIDPRGVLRGMPSLYGDLRYDIAKLGHSIVGRYDQIVAGQLRCTREATSDFALEVPDDTAKRWLEERFRAMTVDGIGFDEPIINAIMVSLFLSMIPLHPEDAGRQDTFLANALRLASRLPDRGRRADARGDRSA